MSSAVVLCGEEAAGGCIRNGKAFVLRTDVRKRLRHAIIVVNPYARIALPPEIAHNGARSPSRICDEPERVADGCNDFSLIASEQI